MYWSTKITKLLCSLLYLKKRFRKALWTKHLLFIPWNIFVDIYIFLSLHACACNIFFLLVSYICFCLYHLLKSLLVHSYLSFLISQPHLPFICVDFLFSYLTLTTLRFSTCILSLFLLIIFSSLLLYIPNHSTPTFSWAHSILNSASSFLLLWPTT